MRDLIDLLIRSHIPLLIIGGQALGLHGAQRDTIDRDCVLVAQKREEMKAFLESRGFEETARHATFSRYRHRSLMYPLLDVMEVDAATWAELWAESVPKMLFGRIRLANCKIAQILCGCCARTQISFLKKSCTTFASAINYYRSLLR